MQVRASADNPIQVMALVRQKDNRTLGQDASESPSDLKRLEVINGDLTEPASLTFRSKHARKKALAIDAVYHLAAVTLDIRASRDTLRKVNLEGTKNLFNAVGDTTRHFVYISGSAVFDPDVGGNGAPGERLVNESSPKRTNLEYIKLRLEAENFLRESCTKSGIDFTVVYFPDIVYGNGGTFRQIFLEQISKGKFRVPGSGEYHTNFIHLDDAVDILITVGLKRSQTANESFIACDSGPAPFRDFVNFIADQLGVKRPGSVPIFLAKAAVGSDLIKMLMKDTRASNCKIRGIYDFKYPSYKTGIPDVISQFRSSL